MRLSRSLVCFAALCHGCTIQNYSFYDEDGGVRSDVTGTARVVHVTSAGEVETPIDLSMRPPAALTRSGNTFTESSGSGAADGTFTIPGVPTDAEYYLRFGADYVVTRARTLDLGYAQLGRADHVRATSPSQLRLTVGGLSPWQMLDHLNLYSLNAGAAAFFVEPTTPAPTPGTMTIDFTFDYARTESPFLIDGRRGDILYLTQLVTRRTSGSRPYQTVGKIASTGPDYVQAGLLTGNFGADVQQTQQVMISDWRRSAFEGLRNMVNPGVQTANVNYRVTLLTVPAGATRGYYDFGAYVLDFLTTDSVNLNAGTLNYGNPFPPEWTLVSSVAAIYAMAYGTVTINAIVGSSAQGIGSLQTSIVPNLGPVVSPKVDSTDAFTGEPTGISANANLTLTWSAPTLGRPGGYVVYVFRLADARAVAAIHTSGTTVIMPPGVLQVGNTYVFKIRAIAEQGIDLSQHPFRSALPEQIADTLTSRVRITGSGISR